MNTERPFHSLRYPILPTMLVYRDDGEWPDRWFGRSAWVLADLFVGRYEFPTDERGDVAYDSAVWAEVSAMIVADNPGCIFIYT